MKKILDNPIPFTPYPVGPPGVTLKYRCYDGKSWKDCIHKHDVTSYYCNMCKRRKNSESSDR